MYYSSPQIDPVRNAVSSSEQTSLRCSSLPTQRARCTDRHANRECVCSCVHQHTHTHPCIDALTVGSRRREDSAKCPALLLWSVDVLSSYKDCDTNVDCPRHPPLSLSVSPVSHSSFPLLPVPLSPSLPSTLPPATFVPFNAANDCRFFPLLFTLQLSCEGSPTADSLPLSLLPRPLSLPQMSLFYRPCCSLSTPWCRPSHRLWSAVTSAKIHFYCVS